MLVRRELRRHNMVSEPNHHPTKRSLKELLAVYIYIGSAILRGRSVKVYEF